MKKRFHKSVKKFNYKGKNFNFCRFFRATFWLSQLSRARSYEKTTRKQTTKIFAEWSPGYRSVTSNLTECHKSRPVLIIFDGRTHISPQIVGLIFLTKVSLENLFPVVTSSIKHLLTLLLDQRDPDRAKVKNCYYRHKFWLSNPIS